MTGYTRNDTSNNIADGNVINAADLDGEFDAIQTAFDGSTGHTHDGTAANGAPITKVGPSQDVTVSATEVAPKLNNTVSLGTSTLQFKDLHLDGTANIDSLVADTADINGGTIDGTTIGATTASTGAFTTVTATTFTGALSGNASTATSAGKWTTARTLSFTGDVTGTGSVDGSANVATAMTLANSGVTEGTYGSGSAIPSVTVDAKGRVTAVTTNSLVIPTYGTATSTTTGMVKLASDTDQTVAFNAVTATAGRTYGVQLNASDQMVVNVPWTDTNTTYSKATTTNLGLVKLEDDTVQTVAANTVTATASRTYGVQLNSADQMVVNVPWTDTNTTYNIATSTVPGIVEVFSDTDQTVAANAVTATAGRTYGIQLNSANQMVVNVPWVDTNTTYSQATASTLGLIKLEDDTVQTVAANTVTATAGRTYGVQVNSSGQAVVNVPWVDTNTDTNNYVSGVSFSTSTGVLTLNRSGLTDLTVDLDGKYAESGHSHSNYMINNGNTSTTGYIQAEGFVNSSTGSLSIFNPQGASYATTTSSVTGAIKITLPQTWTSTMLRMTIRVYEYTTNEAFDVVCGGYNTPSTWANNPFAYIIGSPNVNRNFNVRFGHDGTKCCIYIGETTSTWSYPQVAVTHFVAGYSNYTAEQWNDGWAVGFATTLGTITATVSNSEIGRYLDSQLVLHAGNYNNYAPSKTGTGASGTWPISISGSSASTTGNAATATRLATSRTINGVAFNGSANIVVEPYIEDDNTTNATRYIVFTDNSTAGYKRLNEDSTLWYNPSLNKLSAGIVAANIESDYVLNTGVVSTKYLTVTGGIITNSNTITTSMFIYTGDNGMSAGPITINNGITVTVEAGSAWTIV